MECNVYLLARNSVVAVCTWRRPLSLFFKDQRSIQLRFVNSLCSSSLFIDLWSLWLTLNKGGITWRRWRGDYPQQAVGRRFLDFSENDKIVINWVNQSDDILWIDQFQRCPFVLTFSVFIFLRLGQPRSNDSLRLYLAFQESVKLIVQDNLCNSSYPRLLVDQNVWELSEFATLVSWDLLKSFYYFQPN